VWFSQKISFGRGLEQVLDAISLLNTQKEEAINLTLIGEMDDGFYQQVILPKLEEAKPCFVFMHIPPLSQPELHAELANHDVGLAMEFNSTDLNRQLCLTNKILAYAQAGLYILATDTPAQKDFLTQNPWSGFVCGQTEKAIMKALMLLIDQRIDIQEKALERFHKAKALAWENEGEKFRAMLTSVACQ
jgi:glycosyltransferase involved in cell wall biosynthesis